MCIYLFYLFIYLSGGIARGGGKSVKNQSNDKTIKTQDFSENENKNHTDEKSGLLSSTTNTSITNNTNSKTSSKTSKSDRETSTKMNKTTIYLIFLFFNILFLFFCCCWLILLQFEIDFDDF